MVLISIEKVKPRFSLSLMFIFSESNEANFWSHSLHLQNSGILQTRTDERKGRPHENEFWQFSNTKMNITNRAQKADEKKWGHLPNFLFPSWVMVLKLARREHFCKFVLTSARNLNLLKQFISIHLKDLIMLFQKIVFFIEFWATIHKILKNKISKKNWLSRNLTKFINFKH